MKKIFAFALLTMSITDTIAGNWKPQPEYKKPVAKEPPSDESKESKESEDSASWEWDTHRGGKLDLRGNIKRKFAITAALENTRNNLVCSPISALLPLGKLALGAKGGTLNELLSAVGVSRRSKLKRSMRKLIKRLKHLSGVRLDIASRVYVSEEKKLDSKFQKDAVAAFDSSIKKVDFKNPSSAAKTVNNWVSQETKGKITKLLSSSDISPSSSALLVNAIYFSGKWSKPFDKVLTGSFRNFNGVSRIPMMSITTNLPYYKSPALGAQMVAIPYQNKKASFLIVLPDTQEGLRSLLSELKVAPELLRKAVEKMQSVKVQLTMPKFKIESELDLKHFYTKVGVSSIFTKSSGLTDIVKDETVYVSKGIQKAIIEVSEHGTTAGAAAGVNMVGLSHMEPLKLNVNHPFIYYIMIGAQQLFAGVLVSPPSTSTRNVETSNLNLR